MPAVKPITPHPISDAILIKISQTVQNKMNFVKSFGIQRLITFNLSKLIRRHPAWRGISYEAGDREKFVFHHILKHFMRLSMIDKRFIRSLFRAQFLFCFLIVSID